MGAPTRLTAAGARAWPPPKGAAGHRELCGQASQGGGQAADEPAWASCSFPAVLITTQGAPSRSHDMKEDRDLHTGAHKSHREREGRAGI